jgi:hypothetical protein
MLNSRHGQALPAFFQFQSAANPVTLDASK